MPTLKVPFATQSYRSRSKPLSAQRLMNLYPESAPQDAKSPVVLYGTPGLASFATVGTGPIRGQKPMAGVLYVVSGNALYRVTSTGAATSLGTVPGSGPVYMVENGYQLGVLNDLYDLYVYNKDTAAFAQVTDPDFGEAATVDYIDGYGVFTRPDSEEFFLSDLRDLTAYDALDFAAAESSTDGLVRVFVNRSEVWLFGNQTTEVWVNTGAADFPLERVAGAILQCGIIGARAVTSVDGVVYWIGDDRVIYRGAGYQEERVSTPAIDALLDGFATVSDAEMFSYTQEGHPFVVCNFPSESVTIVFDPTTGMWHERGTWNPATGDFSRWIVGTYAACYGKHLVGHYSTGALYELDLDTYTEDGAEIVRQAVSPPISMDNVRMTFSALQIDLEAGVGLNTGQGSDPQVRLDWSDDGARTWSNPRSVTFGPRGAYRQRAMFRRLGQARERVFRLWISDPVKVAVIGAVLDFEKGTS